MRPSRIYDLRAHQELARAFPALAARLRSLLLTETGIECPAGHKLRVFAQLAAAGREVYCPKCRSAFRPALHPEVEVPKRLEAAAAPEPPVPSSRPGLDRQGLGRIAEGLRLLVRAAGALVPGRRGPLRVRFARSGGWMTSTVMHIALLLLAMFLGAGAPRPGPEPELVIESAVLPDLKQEFIEEQRRHRDVFTKPHRVDSPVEVPLPELVEPRPPDAIEELSEDPVEKPPGRPMPDLTTPEIPAELLQDLRPGLPAALGLGSPQAETGALALRGDSQTRLKAAERGGGGPDTENAVERALEWLARNRQGDGGWDLNGRAASANPAGGWGAQNASMRPAMTGFALLAFLGAGYSHRGGHKHGEKVRDGLDWLMKSQAADGSFSGRTRQCGYSQGIATLALVEASAMGTACSDNEPDFDRRLRAAAQRGVDFIVRSQNRYAGWDYEARGGTSDTSITVWNCMALKSARVAGLKVDATAFQGIVNWLETAQSMREWAPHDHFGRPVPAGRDQEGKGGSTPERGWTGGEFGYRGAPGRGTSPRGTLLTVMNPAGLMMRLMTGTAPDRREAYGPANMLLTLVPEAPEAKMPDEELDRQVEAFIDRTWRRWDSMTEAQRAGARAAAEREVASFPRTVEAYVARHYAQAWPRMTEGQQASLRETARQAVAGFPGTVEEYLDRNYRQWEGFSAEQRERHRSQARAAIESQFSGPGLPRSLYFVYHGSLAMFQMGGRHWKAWNPRMKKLLLGSQARGGDGDGSWPPDGHCVGQVMATAVGAMTLEVYYRYLRFYEAPEEK